MPTKAPSSLFDRLDPPRATPLADPLHVARGGLTHHQRSLEILVIDSRTPGDAGGDHEIVAGQPEACVQFLRIRVTGYRGAGRLTVTDT